MHLPLPLNKPVIDHALCADLNSRPARRLSTPPPFWPTRRQDCSKKIVGTGKILQSSFIDSVVQADTLEELLQPNLKFHLFNISKHAGCCSPKTC
jgi:hypothetical protein